MELSDEVVKALTAPAKGNRITYDAKLKGFGVRVTAAGAKAYVLNYTLPNGRERRYTIGPVAGGKAWTLAAARKHAEALKAKVRLANSDPLGDLEKGREARKAERARVTVEALCDRFEALHLPRLRPASQREYKSLLKLIRADLGDLKVQDVGHTHAERLHRKVSERAKFRANRVAAVGSKLFSFAARTPAADDLDSPMRPDGVNPFRGIERNPEDKRHRYLKPAEVAALSKALDGLEDVQAANVVRLLLLTGARKGELLAARWRDFDLVVGVWEKPGATTKQKTVHRVPLSEPALKLLRGMLEAARKAARERDEVLENDGYLFPGRNVGQPHRVEIRNAWRDASIAAKLVRPVFMKRDGGELVTVLQPVARVHDLRHSYASMLASAGLSLPIIGALLGHTQPTTTARYAGLLDETLRAATARVGELVAPEPAK